VIAPALYQSLCDAKNIILRGEQKLREVEQQQQAHLNKRGFKVDYFSICNSDNLQQANDRDKNIVILAAAKLGKPRLIDNISFARQ
jgi:pantoate--beta-alanine ligase